MIATGYTQIYNNVLCDNHLSLTAKGLYSMIKSFIGLPSFTLTKKFIALHCSDSTYGINNAWKELKASGYLQHYFYNADDNTFCHIFNLCQMPATPAAYQYIDSSDRPNGDCQFIEAPQRGNFTRISPALLRNKNIALPLKGLFSLITYLMQIPDFTLRPNGIRYFCKEKVKKFATLWRRLKIAGLLKQHRYPGNDEPTFTYSYDLLDQPDTETPYLVNHHMDGSVSSVTTIDNSVPSKKNRSHKNQKKKHRQKNNLILRHKSTPSTSTTSTETFNQIKQAIDYEKLQSKYDHDLVDVTVAALADLLHTPTLFIQQQRISLDERQSLLSNIRYDDVVAFFASTKIDLTHATNRVLYLRSIVYHYFSQRQATSAKAESVSDPSSELEPWEIDWLQDMQSRRKASQKI